MSKRTAIIIKNRRQQPGAKQDAEDQQPAKNNKMIITE
jgi:hypothetical protein